jgi:acetyl esterase/lipase
LAQFYLHCNYLASRGMVAMCVDRRNGRRPGLSEEDENAYRAAYTENLMIQDAKSVFRYIRGHADELGIAPGKLAGGCSSYGGFTLANTCIANQINEEGENTSIDCRPVAMVMFDPVVDRSPSGYHHETIKNWENVSPLHCLNADFPPTLLMVGDRDPIIPTSTATLYQQTLKAMGIRCDLRIFPGTGHGFNKLRYYEAMHEVDRFLVSLGLLSGKATLRRQEGSVEYSNASDAGQ